VSKYWIAAPALIVLTLGLSCHSGDEQEAQPGESTTSAPGGSFAPDTETAAGPAAASIASIDGPITGSIVETMDSAGYTYALIDTGSTKVWVATSRVPVALGEEVTFDGSMPMAGYHSPSLDRTFDLIYFTDSIKPGAATSPDPHAPEMGGMGAMEEMGSVGAPAAAETSVERLGAADGGVTVEEVFTKREDLVGTTVVIRGKVVKFSPLIMGKNWLHIQDGTGAVGTNDLTVTTDATVEVGATVLVRGVLIADKDFGFGYQYDLIIEDAEITVE
jgi:hypothetical protein